MNSFSFPILYILQTVYGPWAFHRKTTWNDFSSYSNAKLAVKDMLTDIHPLSAPNDLEPRPSTTSILRKHAFTSGQTTSSSNSASSITRASNKTQKNLLNSSRDTLTIQNNKNHNNDKQKCKLSSKGCSDNEITSEIKGGNMSDDNFKMNGQKQSLRKPIFNSNRTNPWIYPMIRKGTPKQWSGFNGLGSGKDMHVKSARRRYKIFKAIKNERINKEAKETEDYLSAFELHLKRIAQGSIT